MKALSVAGLAVSLALISPASATVLWTGNGHEIGTHGYLRTGSGWSERRKFQSCFWAPGASSKYRLGNECEHYATIGLYGKLSLGDNVLADYLKYEFRTPFEGIYGDPIEADPPIMNYFEVGGIAGTTAKFWVGRRESFKKDIHITDYSYMNLKGDGLGLYDIPAGPFQLGYALYVARILEKNEATGDVYQFNHDFSVSGIDTNPGGSLTIDTRLTRIDDDGSGIWGVHAADGWALSARHEQTGFLGGTNTLVVQYGAGAARAAFAYPEEAFWVAEKLSWNDNARFLEDAETFRVLDTYLYEGDRWSMMALALWEVRRSKEFDFVDQTWFSAGARANFYLDDHWRLTGEFGLDHVVDHANETEGQLRKETIALEWTPDTTFLSRPALRAYITRADWTEDFRGRVGWPNHADETGAWSTGLQMEYWW